MSQLGERVRRQTVIVMLVMGLAWGLQAEAAGQRLVDHTNADPSFFYVKLGYRRQFSKIGATSFGVDYFYGSDRAVNDEEVAVSIHMAGPVKP